MCDFEINGVLVTKLRVVDLKEELEARGLSKSGKKDELIARLVSYLEANPDEATRIPLISGRHGRPATKLLSQENKKFFHQNSMFFN